MAHITRYTVLRTSQPLPVKREKGKLREVVVQRVRLVHHRHKRHAASPQLLLLGVAEHVAQILEESPALIEPVLTGSPRCADDCQRAIER